MDFVKRAVRKFTGSGPTFGYVVKLLSGTTLAQLITLVSMIPLARLYGPEQFGLFAIIQSMVAIAVSVASLRYDMAIVLPKTDLEARVVQLLASRSILFTSLLFSVVFLVGNRWVVSHYGSPALATWLVISGSVVYLTSQVANRQFWLTRRRKFGEVASNRVFSTAATGGFQLLAALGTRGFEGLLVGLIAGQFLTLLFVNSKVPELRTDLPPDAPTPGAMARRYKKMPLLNGPNALVDAVRNSGINLLIANIAVAGLGQYSMAFRVTAAPAALINGAIAQVFLQKMSVTKPGKMLGLIGAVLLRIALVSVPVFTLFYFVSPKLLPFIFGLEWTESGLFAQALVPWIFMLTFTSPLSNLFIVAERQGALLAFAVLYAAAPLLFLYLSPYSLLSSVRILAWIMASCLLFLVILAVVVARSYDRRQSIK